MRLLLEYGLKTKKLELLREGSRQGKEECESVEMRTGDVGGGGGGRDEA